MDDLQDVYNDLIMEHSMNSYNKKKLETCDLCEMGHNPNCGDEIELQVKLNGDVIEDMAFSGHGCAISQASTSIMIDTLKGKTVEEAYEIYQNFVDMVEGKNYNVQKLENAIVYNNINKQPSRKKCALLPWLGIKKILDRHEKKV